MKVLSTLPTVGLVYAEPPADGLYRMVTEVTPDEVSWVDTEGASGWHFLHYWLCRYPTPLEPTTQESQDAAVRITAVIDAPGFTAHAIPKVF